MMQRSSWEVGPKHLSAQTNIVPKFLTTKIVYLPLQDDTGIWCSPYGREEAAEITLDCSKRLVKRALEQLELRCAATD